MHRKPTILPERSMCMVFVSGDASVFSVVKESALSPIRLSIKKYIRTPYHTTPNPDIQKMSPYKRVKNIMSFASRVGGCISSRQYSTKNANISTHPIRTIYPSGNKIPDRSDVIHGNTGSPHDSPVIICTMIVAPMASSPIMPPIHNDSRPCRGRRKRRITGVSARNMKVISVNSPP